ncbi:MAG: carbohydrate binding family 9 domain-containing protein [Bacteroidetes bacterium]|nr:carbohydrate binding family 9 domain-containing protein [Bacteroidota bacterium]
MGQNLEYTLSDDSLVNVHASNKRAYYATRTNIVPKIDGVLNDECWKLMGKWDGGFIQQQPHQAKAPSQETEIKILYDDKYLYFAIKCYDNEPEKMNPILGRRDDYTVGDIAGIALDSYNDKQTAFEFNLTSAGQKVDLMHMGEYGWDFNWDAVWDGKTSIGDSAWYAEMRVPFTQLRFSNEKEHVWGMHIWRYIYRLSEESQWKLIPIDAPAMVYIFGELRGIKDIPYKRNFEVMPYAKAKYVTDSQTGEKFGAGLDGKIGITSDFTLDYTINPDFGQVEADPSELNLTSYETFYDEKRPFFLEGKSILEYNAGLDQLFYSRRIGSAPSYTPYVDEGDDIKIPNSTTIINALKLTGKSKSGLSLGVVNSMTAKENAIISFGNSEEQKAVEPFTNYFMGRVKQDLNNGNTVLGGILTSTIRNIKDEHLEFLSDNSLIGGVDIEHNWLNRKYFVTGKSFFSKIDGSKTAISRLQRSSRHLYQREDADHLDFNTELMSLKGWGGEINGGKRSGKFQIDGMLDWRSPGVDFNDMGYMKQADYIKQHFGVLYQINKPNGIFLNYYFNIDQRHHWSFGGENLKDELDGHLKFRLKNYWNFNVDLDRTYNEIDTRQLRGGPSLRIDGNTSGEIFMQTNSSKDIHFFGGADLTRYDDGITIENDYTFGFQWMVSNRFSISSRSNFVAEIDNSQYVFQETINDNREYVVGKINRNTIYTTLRAEYFITPEISLQYYGSPYASTGKYLDYRKVEDSKAKNLDDRYSFLNVVENEHGKFLYDDESNLYHDFNDWDPDFNFQEFSSNFVARWEYKTGSTIYFVWTNYRSNYEEGHNPSIVSSLTDISTVKAQNAFMIKLSYWFSL